jgi:hypothetical protein
MKGEKVEKGVYALYHSGPDALVFLWLKKDGTALINIENKWKRTVASTTCKTVRDIYDAMERHRKAGVRE